MKKKKNQQQQQQETNKGFLMFCKLSSVMSFKGALDKYNIIPQLFAKKWDFYTIRSDGMGNDYMLSFTFQIDLLLKKYEYF